MKLIPLDETGRYAVETEGGALGTVTLYDNPFHRRHAYVKLDGDQWSPDQAPALFAALRAEAGRPLQVMTPSWDTRLTDLLTAGGFRLARRCWEVTASPGDYVGPDGLEEPVWLAAEDAAYGLCAKMLYEHYKKTHEAVSPLTADRDVFCASLPQQAACRTAGGEVAALAFVEENEIAYVWGRSEEEFISFAAGLVKEMFRRDRLLFFECDDCDGPALWLKSLFRAPENEGSYDTYVYDPDDGEGGE